MKAMPGQAWRNISTGRFCIFDKRYAKEINKDLFFARVYGWRPVFKWHNENSEGE